MSGSQANANLSSMTVASKSAGVFPVGFGYYPPEGSRVVSAQYNWASLPLSVLVTPAYTFNEDLSQLVAMGVETSIQSLFVDNSLCSFNVTIIVEGTQHVLIIPAYSQGMFPVLFTGTPKLSITSPGQYNSENFVTQCVTRIAYLNVPASPAIWPVPPSPAAKYVQATSGPLAFKTGPGVVFTVAVLTTTTADIIAVRDGGLNIFTIPSGTLAGTVYQLNMPFATRLIVVFYGTATGTISVSYT